MSRVLDLPAVICRMDVQYGTFSDGGMPVKFLSDVINRVPIHLPSVRSWVKTLIHEDDLFAFVAPCLGIAGVPAPVVNWAGDEAVVAEDWTDYLGELVGEEPIYVYDESRSLPGGAPSAALRTSITGPVRVRRDGLRRVVEYWEPPIRSGSHQKRGA